MKIDGYTFISQLADYQCSANKLKGKHITNKKANIIVGTLEYYGNSKAINECNKTNMQEVENFSRTRAV